jgi:transposase-like protein
VVVEIDESKFAKRKYNRGHSVKGGWVLGGREKENAANCFFVPVPNRTSETLIDLIKLNVAPGTIIHTDCWKGYDRLGREGYEHLTVNHSVEFVNSITGVHTNGIESDWQKIKRGVHFPRFGVKDDHLGGYLAEHIWRGKGERRNLFPLFVREVAKIFDGGCKKKPCCYCD